MSLIAPFKLRMWFLKGALGVKRSSPNWAHLGCVACGQEPLQFYRFHAVAKFFNSLFCGKSGLLKKIVHANIALSASYKMCWTAEFIEACEVLRASNRFTDRMKAAIPLPFQDFVVNLREGLHAVWRELDGAGPRTHARKLATYYAWMASPLKPSTARGPPHLHADRYQQLELSK